MRYHCKCACHTKRDVKACGDCGYHPAHCHENHEGESHHYEHVCQKHRVEHCCDCHECHHHEHCYENHDRYHGKGDDSGKCGNPNRPGKNVGVDRGRLSDPTPMTPGDWTTQNPPDSWVGPRKDLYLPFLFMRANPGDLGTRPVPGPFWESPDVLILAGVEPSMAPPIPPQLGETALAGKPNTVYAHVWNFGLAQAPNVVVEFRWCDPSLGFGSGLTHLIGQTMVSLGARGSGRSHAVVKCPEAWVPTFLNGGHECLLVRVWDETSDALGTPPWDAKLNRHLGQRNIHVVPAPDSHKMKAAAEAAPTTPHLNTPVILNVGPLYGAPAQVSVSRVAPNTMPWLQLHTGVRGQFPQQAVPTGEPVLSRPGSSGGGLPTGGAASQHYVTGDDQQVAFTTSDAPPSPGQAHVYRVSASQDGEVFGGYTVVLLG